MGHNLNTQLKIVRQLVISIDFTSSFNRNLPLIKSIMFLKKFKISLNSYTTPTTF